MGRLQAPLLETPDLGTTARQAGAPKAAGRWMVARDSLRCLKFLGQTQNSANQLSAPPGQNTQDKLQEVLKLATLLFNSPPPLPTHTSFFV